MSAQDHNALVARLGQAAVVIMLPVAWGIHAAGIHNSLPGSISVGPQLNAVSVEYSTERKDDPAEIVNLQNDLRELQAVRQDKARRGWQ
jgi:hypothetical protein